MSWIRRSLAGLLFLAAASLSAQTSTPTVTQTPTPTVTITPTPTATLPGTTQITGLPATTVTNGDEFVVDKLVSGVRRTRKVTADDVGDFLDINEQWDAVRVEDGDNTGTFTVMDNVDLDDSGDINFTRAAGPPDVATATIRDDKVTEADLKAVNAGTDEYCLTFEVTTGDFEWQTCPTGAGSGMPGGSDTQVQYNDAGAFGGDAGLTYNETTNVVTVTAGSVIGSDAAGPALLDEAASSTNPTLAPNRAAPDDGLGHNTSQSCPTLVEAGVEVVTACAGAAYIGPQTGGGVILNLRDQGNLRLWEEIANGTNYLGFSPPATLSSNATCLLEDDSSFIPDACVGDGVDGGASTTPGSPDTSIQYNDGGAFGGDAGLTYDETTNVVTVTSGQVVGSNAAAAALLDEAASATNPTLVPNKASLDDGLGHNAAGCPVLIEAGVLSLEACAGSVVAGAEGQTTNITASDAGQIASREDDANGTSRAGFQAPTSLTADRICTFADTARTIPESCVGLPTAFAANGANCSAGNYPLGVDAAGAVESCTADDDVPESGDFAAGADLDADGGITDNQVLEAHLKAVDSATDEECLTYETTTGDFEWQECGSAGTGGNFPGYTMTGGSTPQDDTDTYWYVVSGRSTPSLAENDNRQPLPAWTPTELNCTTSGSGISSGTLVMTLRRNGVGTDWGCTITSTNCSDTSGSTLDAGSFTIEADPVDVPVDLGVIRCYITVAGGSGGGDEIRVEDGDDTNAFTATTDADFEDSGDINFVLTGNDVSGTVRANAVALGTDTTENYVATIADSGNTTVTVANSGTESAAVTLNVIDVNCTGCLSATELATSAVATAEILDDTILEVDLKAVDAASDEECLTFETTTGDFEWQACASGGGDDVEVNGSATTGANLIDSTDVTFTLDTGPTPDTVALTVVNDSHAHTTTTISGILAADMGDADHGDVTWSSSVASVEDDSHAHTTTTISGILAADMGDADHGDITWASSVASVEDNSHAHTTTTLSGIDIGDDTNLAAGRSLTLSGDSVEADQELFEHTKCINVDPNHTTTDWLFFRAERAITLIGIDCIVDAATSVVLTLRECNADAASCGDSEAAITCAATNTTEATSIDDAAVDAGDWMRVTRGTETGTVTQATLCVTFTVAD